MVQLMHNQHDPAIQLKSQKQKCKNQSGDHACKHVDGNRDECSGLMFSQHFDAVGS